MPTQIPGHAPYKTDDTRRWAETYRVNNKIKPALVVRAATDSNYINDQALSLPAYNGATVNAAAMSNVVAPGQRLTGCLDWEVTESNDNVIQQATLTVLDILPISTVTTTANGYGVGTGNPLYKGLYSGGLMSDDVLVRQSDKGKGVSGTASYPFKGDIKTIPSLPARWHSTTIRYQWAKDGLGIAQKLVGDKRVDQFFDQSLKGNLYVHHFQEERVVYRMFEPEVIICDASKFPDPAAHISEMEGPFEWWDIDCPASYQIGTPLGAPGGHDHDPNNPNVTGPGISKTQGALSLANVRAGGDLGGGILRGGPGVPTWMQPLNGIGAYYILVEDEVMRITRIQRNPGQGNDYMFVIPGGRGAAGKITNHGKGATITLLGHPPFTGKWTGMGYLTPTDYRVIQSPMRPGTCWVSYEGYGNPGDYTAPRGEGPFTTKAISQRHSKKFDRNNNMCFTGYWFSHSPQLTLDASGVAKLQVTFSSAGYISTDQQIDPNNIQRSKNAFFSWAKTTFDSIGLNRKLPGDWYDYNMWDPELPGSYPLTVSTMFAQDKAFFDHMQDTNMGRECQICQLEWYQYVTQHEHGKPTGNIAEARVVGKHIYKESIRVFDKGTHFNAGPLKTFGRLMNSLAVAAWENPQPGTELGTRWTKMPDVLFDHMTNFINGRVWNGQLSYDNPQTTKHYDWSNATDTDLEVYGVRKPLKCPFTVQYDRQPWSQPMTDLAALNNMVYLLSREGFPIFAPIGRKLRGIPNFLLQRQPHGLKETSKNEPAQFVGNSVPWDPDAIYVPATASGVQGTAGVNSAVSASSSNHYNLPTGPYGPGAYLMEVADNDAGLGEWHLAYGGSIDQYSFNIDPTQVLTLVYVSCQTAFADEVTFTIPAAGTGVAQRNFKHKETNERVVMYSNKIGNKEGLQLTGGAQLTDAVSLDNVLLGLEWNTQPASWGLTLQRGQDNTTQVDAQPPIPRPHGYFLYYESKGAKEHPKVVEHIQRFINFMMERRYIGAAVFDRNGTIVYPIQLNVNGKFTGNDGKALDSGIKKVQQFFSKNQQGNLLTTTDNGQHWHYQGNQWTFTDNAGQWGQATYNAAKAWLHASAEYIKTDVWWYVQNGLPWDQYVAAITGLKIPERRAQFDKQLWTIDQAALATTAQTWMKRFFIDGLDYGNSLVDQAINKSTQKTITCNLADPRIFLGDVIWADVTGYSTSDNAFGSAQAPYLHGIWITQLTRTMDLSAGTYQATYSGTRYRGNNESNVTTNPNNFVSSRSNI